MDISQIQLVAEKALGLTPSETDKLIESGEDYDTPLKERFGVDLDTFANIVNALIPLTPIIQEPKTNHLVHAFVSFENGSGNIIAGQAFDTSSAIDKRVSL